MELAFLFLLWNLATLRCSLGTFWNGLGLILRSSASASKMFSKGTVVVENGPPEGLQKGFPGLSLATASHAFDQRVRHIEICGFCTFSFWSGFWKWGGRPTLQSQPSDRAWDWTALTLRCSGPPRFSLQGTTMVARKKLVDTSHNLQFSNFKILGSFALAKWCNSAVYFSDFVTVTHKEKMTQCNRNRC